jgi:hypothetical protein
MPVAPCQGGTGLLNSLLLDAALQMNYGAGWRSPTPTSKAASLGHHVGCSKPVGAVATSQGGVGHILRNGCCCCCDLPG